MPTICLQSRDAVLVGWGCTLCSRIAGSSDQPAIQTESAERRSEFAPLPLKEHSPCQSRPFWRGWGSLPGGFGGAAEGEGGGFQRSFHAENRLVSGARVQMLGNHFKQQDWICSIKNSKGRCLYAVCYYRFEYFIFSKPEFLLAPFIPVSL